MPATGPRTDEGKARSAQNARTHGLTSRALLAPGEHPDDFAVFAAELVDALAPQDAVERVLAERVAVAFWRVQRCARVEAGLLTQSEPTETDTLLATVGGKPPAPPCVSAFAYGGDAGLALLARYEAHLERTAYRAMKELRARRKLLHN